MYRQLKNEYFQTRLDEYRKSPAQLWSAINFITGRKNQHFPVSASIPDLETHFKSLFSNPGPPIAIPLGPANASAMLEFMSVSAAEVKRMLSDLVTSKAPGPDGILPSDLKLVAGEVAPTIAILFNESLATGLLPEQFRMANLVPVFKPGKTDTSSANNYRGISLTCILSKVLEKIVFNQLNDYLTQCGALSDNQYGFRRGRSCADLLLTTLDDWYLAQDAKKFTAIAFIDLSKAFDNVRHELLLLTLQKVGVNGTVLAWFYNYLNNRQQQIVTQESPSTLFLCSKGVPQGSVLGPLLFNLYVSDLARLADERGASLPSFADDFTLYASCKDRVDACDTVSNVLGVLDKALGTLGLQINEIKSVAMLIPPQSDKSSCENCKIVLRGSELNLVSETRLLGVIIEAPGPDGILPSELKLVAGEVASTIAILFNESLATGLLPEQFRMANLVPVFKPGKTDTSSANNYRGISLTCILSKVLEKIVFNQLNDYLTQCGALSDNQYGFRRGRSCADLLLTTLDDWYLAQDAKKLLSLI